MGRLGRSPGGVIDFYVMVGESLHGGYPGPLLGKSLAQEGIQRRLFFGEECPTHSHRLRRSHLQKYDKGQAGPYLSKQVNLCREQSTYPMAHFMNEILSLVISIVACRC
jgi:hypothetical protein